MSRILKCGYAPNPQAWLMAAALMRGHDHLKPLRPHFLIPA